MANQLWTSRFGIAVILFGLVCVVLPNTRYKETYKTQHNYALAKLLEWKRYSYLGHGYKSHIHQGLQCSN